MWTPQDEMMNVVWWKETLLQHNFSFWNYRIKTTTQHLNTNWKSINLMKSSNYIEFLLLKQANNWRFTSSFIINSASGVVTSMSLFFSALCCQLTHNWNIYITFFWFANILFAAINFTPPRLIVHLFKFQLHVVIER